MLPSFHGSLGFLFWLSLNPFWAMEFFFSLDRFSGVGSSHSPLRAMVFFFFFFFSIRFFFSGKKASKSGTGDNWQGCLLSLYTVEARSMYIHRSQHNTRPSMMFTGLLRFYCLKSWPHRTSVPDAWPARAKDLLLGQSRVWATLRLPGCDRWFLAAACCSGVPRDCTWSSRAVSGNNSLPRCWIYDLMFSILVFQCSSVVFLQVCLLNF
jgi:hypothetical protein